MRRLLSLLVVGLIVSPALAAPPILDGTTDASYGAAAAVQTVQTGFGDNFSELDAGYGQITGGKLYLMLTGNIEANQNRLEVFIDSKAGGQNVLLNNGSTPTNDSWAPAYAGFTFDSGFTADYMLILRRSGTSFNVDLATIGGGASAFEAATNIFGGASTGANANALPLAGVGVAYDNSNSAGVTGGSGAADQTAAALVSTGLELAIPLAAIGNPASAIRISAMVNSADPHTYLSNQFLGGLPAGQGNLGGDGTGAFTGTVGAINLNSYAGNQYFTVGVPEPTSIVLAGWAVIGMAGCLWRRKQLL
jgi:hypothetical protein